MRRYLLVLLFILSGISYAQELNCTVEFNTSQVAATNQQIFKTLQASLVEFVSNTKWTDKVYKPNEKINCSFFFNITSFDNVNQFTGSLQVQASRPVFNSSYSTSILNLNDKDVSFTYNEFQVLAFNPNGFDSNLISVIAFYANMIIAFDSDSFALEGGNKALDSALNIVNLAQQTQEKGWMPTGNQNRYYLVNDMISPMYSSVRKAMYEYHLEALDKMVDDAKNAKLNFVKSIKTLSEVSRSRPNAYLTRVFFDAKADEIVSILKDGPKIDNKEVVDILNQLSPTNSSKWSQITY